MTEREKLIESLFSDALFIENIIKAKCPLNDYDCEIMLDITKDIYDVIRILKIAKGANNDD